MSTLFDSDNPRIAAAQARTLDTLMAIPDEYGAVFVIDEYQAELTEAVRAHTEALALAKGGARLAALERRKQRKATVQAVVALDEWRAA